MIIKINQTSKRLKRNRRINEIINTDYIDNKGEAVNTNDCLTLYSPPNANVHVTNINTSPLKNIRMA